MRWILTSLLVLSICSRAEAFDTSIAARSVHLADLLPPPPAAGSIEEQKDMAAVIAATAFRSLGGGAEALADSEYSVFRFADVLGVDFNAANLPITAAFFKQVNEAQRAVIEPPKELWSRPRPFVTNPGIQLLGQPSKSGSYPSGHSHFGYVMAIVLANMLPDKRAEIFDRGERYGQNRIILGAHYPTDVEASRRAATATAASLFADPQFQADMAKAGTELRQVLGWKQ